MHHCMTHEVTTKPRAHMKYQDLELSRKAKELGQQAGIIDYINKLSSNNAEAPAAAATAAALPQEASAAVPPRDGATSIPCVNRH